MISHGWCIRHPLANRETRRIFHSALSPHFASVCFGFSIQLSLVHLPEFSSAKKKKKKKKKNGLWLRFSGVFLCWVFADWQASSQTGSRSIVAISISELPAQESSHPSSVVANVSVRGEESGLDSPVHRLLEREIPHHHGSALGLELWCCRSSPLY